MAWHLVSAIVVDLCYFRLAPWSVVSQGTLVITLMPWHSQDFNERYMFKASDWCWIASDWFWQRVLGFRSYLYNWWMVYWFVCNRMHGSGDCKDTFPHCFFFDNIGKLQPLICIFKSHLSNFNDLAIFTSPNFLSQVLKCPIIKFILWSHLWNTITHVLVAS
jgi:hypothetical protein